MTKLPKPAPAAEPSVTDYERAVAEAAAELGDIRLKITSAEAELPALALDPDDSKYESASLEIGRLQRAQLRAAARLEQAREALAEAKARAEDDRRHGLFEAGRKAAGEVHRLAQEYGRRAAAVAETLRAIDKLRAPIEAANDNLPDGERRIDADHPLRIHSHVELPAVTPDGEALWYRSDYFGFSPLNPRPAVLRFSNAVDALPSAQMPPQAPVAQRTAAPPSKYGERTLPDGSRKITLPPNEWPPRPESN